MSDTMFPREGPWASAQELAEYLEADDLGSDAGLLRVCDFGEVRLRAKWTRPNGTVDEDSFAQDMTRLHSMLPGVLEAIERRENARIAASTPRKGQ